MHTLLLTTKIEEMNIGDIMYLSVLANLYLLMKYIQYKPKYKK
jgi:hypothetical protein